MIELSRFRPHKLESALGKVRLEHPVRDGATTGPTADYLSRVREKLENTPSSGIRFLAAEFKTQELKACLMLLCLDETQEIHEKTESVVTFRQRKDLLGFAWNLLKTYYPVDRLERFVRAVGGKFEWAGVSRNEAEKDRIAQWFVQSRLVAGILADFASSKHSDLEEWLTGVEIQERHRLYGAVIDALLVSFDHGAISKLGHARLLALARARRVEVQGAFCQRHLNLLTGRGEWHVPVLEWILEKFDVPQISREALTPFWRGVDESRRKEFARWANEAVLRDFFEGIQDPHGRFQFWKQFFDYLVRAKKTVSGDIAFLDFGDFGVVEFAEKGNAAYVYPKSELERMSARAEQGFTHPGNFKDPTKTLRTTYGGDGRIIHSQGWQFRHSQWIQRLVKSG